jgi:hypothetical protein
MLERRSRGDISIALTREIRHTLHTLSRTQPPANEAEYQVPQREIQDGVLYEDGRAVLPRSLVCASCGTEVGGLAFTTETITCPECSHQWRPAWAGKVKPDGALLEGSPAE